MAIRYASDTHLPPDAMFVEAIPRLNWKFGRHFSSSLLGHDCVEAAAAADRGQSTSSLPGAERVANRASARPYDNFATVPARPPAAVVDRPTTNAIGYGSDSAIYGNDAQTKGPPTADGAASAHRLLLERVLWIKQQFRVYRAHLAQKMNANASTSVACDVPAPCVASPPSAPSLQTQRSQKCLSVSRIVRQQSETTHAVRRLTLSRSRALLHDDDADDAAGPACDGVSPASERRPTSCNVAGVDDEKAAGACDGKMSSIMSPDAIVPRPTKHVTVVDQQTNDNYIQLNQYRLVEDIGQGSYGIVKLAYNERDKNLYAMKVLDKMKLVKNFACFRPPPARRNKAPPSAVHRDPLQLVQREIAILKKLHHTNVVKLVEVLDDPNDNYLYMVFEYVEHRSLMELPTSSPLDEPTAWKYFRDTLKGLEYLHFQKIVHRDIKPSNLLLSDTGQVKIADFGVSCEFEGIDAFLTGTAGTPAFMAPEALSEKSALFYSGRAQDIWSLGITLYALVFGNVPFWDPYVIALHRKIKNDPIEFPDTPQISESLRSLLFGMLKKDPGHRLLLQEIKQNDWVTRHGTMPMPSEEENCHLVTVTEEEIENCVRVIPRLDTLILVKAMGHRKRFGNPFRKEAPTRAGSHATTQSLKFRRKSSSVRDPLYSPAAESASTSTVPDRAEPLDDDHRTTAEADRTDSIDSASTLPVNGHVNRNYLACEPTSSLRSPSEPPPVRRVDSPPSSNPTECGDDKSSEKREDESLRRRLAVAVLGDAADGAAPPLPPNGRPAGT